MIALDLCSGAAGGWSLGLHRAGIRTGWACELIDWRRQMYATNFPEVKVYADLRTLTGAQLRRDTGAVPDLIVGSPPCKEFSEANQAGRGIEADDLLLHAARLVEECRPRWFALENSRRVKSRGFDRLADALEALGYACWPLVVGAGHAGATHRRQRVFIVGLVSDPARQQARAPRQPWLDPDPHWPDGALPWPDWRRGAQGEGQGRRGGRPAEAWPRGPARDQAVAARLGRVFGGPHGTPDLGRHLRAYDGVPGRLAERCREAYGDAVMPQLTEAVGRAILQVDELLKEIAT